MFAVSGEVTWRPSQVRTHPRDNPIARLHYLSRRQERGDARRMVRRANESRLLTHTTFTALGLPAQILTALDKAGFITPTPIQAKAIPPQMERRDILGIAQTGSGKTAAFGLPILAGIAALKGRPNPMTTRALILAPTRELAVQIEEVLQKLSAGMRLQTVLVLGGVSRNAQIQKIARGADVVIATPGRLKDLLDDRKLRLNETRWLVLDEADRMLDMGFIVPVKQIAAAIRSRVTGERRLFSSHHGQGNRRAGQGLAERSGARRSATAGHDCRHARPARHPVGL